MRLNTVWPVMMRALGLLAASLVAEAQPAQRARRGLLGLGAAAPSPCFAALRHGRRARGWVAGQNIACEDRSTVGHYGRLPEVAAARVRRQVAGIVTSGGTATQAARNATGTMPMGTVAGSEPVETGLAARLARPGGNVTGLATLGWALGGKRLELLQETLPGRARIAVLGNPESRTALVSLRHAEAAATS